MLAVVMLGEGQTAEWYSEDIASMSQTMSITQLCKARGMGVESEESD